MTRSRFGRLSAVLSAAVLALMLLGPATTSAATPGWIRSNAVAILDSVGPGKDAAYTVTLYNDGPGNISTLSFKANKEASYISPSVAGGCTLAPTLSCALGAQNVDQTITFVVAFTVPSSGSSFSVTFSESANGFTTSDKGKNSRGDANSFDGLTADGKVVSVTTGGGNFDAGYNVGSDTFLTNQTVGNKNIQATKLESAPDVTAVTIQDGITTYACQTGVTQCSRLIGEWSKLTVGDGTVGPFKVTILIYGSSVSGNPSPDQLFLVHTNDDNTTNVIDQQCVMSGGLPTNADCLAGVPTKVGKNFQIVAWLGHNGAIRGGW